jgi:hypothetical protein|tara:strand:+ start:79 stop:390 length:312 start_codon:yes stop_codon:yes gene_type:complete
MLNNLIRSGLIFLLLGGVMHVDPHHGTHEQGYGMCDISCNEEQHHSIAHHCEKCLNKNSKSIKYEQKDLPRFFNETLPLFVKHHFNNSYLSFSLYSRPPPSLL